jgi:hypothetical protein
MKKSVTITQIETNFQCEYINDKDLKVTFEENLNNILEFIQFYYNNTQVKSSTIDKVYYNESQKSLLVKFNSGNTLYKYEEVPKDIYDQLMNAQSIGSHFAKTIKNNFKFTKVTKM